MSSLLPKLIFYFKKPQLIIVTGKARDLTAEAIFQVLKSHFDVEKIKKLNLKNILKNKTLIFPSNLEEDLTYFVKNLEKPILVVTHVGEIPPDVYFFAGEKKDVKKILKLAKELPLGGSLILNFDDETVREIGDKIQLSPLTFGFQEANLRASDIKLNTGTNFKVDYQGNIIPVWLENLFGKENIYAALAAMCCGICFGLNLVEISQALKDFQGLEGKMQLKRGIKDSQILDGSASTSPFAMAEALKILGEMKAEGRKIAVLGDILGIERAVQAHESIGEKVAEVADLLFTVGPRAKFFAKGAKIRGLEKTFSFDTSKEVALSLKKEIKKGDLILVNGSKEMKMGEIVKEIKAI